MPFSSNRTTVQHSGLHWVPSYWPRLNKVASWGKILPKYFEISKCPDRRVRFFFSRSNHAITWLPFACILASMWTNISYFKQVENLEHRQKPTKNLKWDAMWIPCRRLTWLTWLTLKTAGLNNHRTTAVALSISIQENLCFQNSFAHNLVPALYWLDRLIQVNWIKTNKKQQQSNILQILNSNSVNSKGWQVEVWKNRWVILPLCGPSLSCHLQFTFMVCWQILHNLGTRNLVEHWHTLFST